MHNCGRTPRATLGLSAPGLFSDTSSMCPGEVHSEGATRPGPREEGAKSRPYPAFWALPSPSLPHPGPHQAEWVGMAQNKKLIKSVSHLHPKIREGGKTSSDYSHAASFRTGVGYGHGRVGDWGLGRQSQSGHWRETQARPQLTRQATPPSLPAIKAEKQLTTTTTIIIKRSPKAPAGVWRPREAVARLSPAAHKKSFVCAEVRPAAILDARAGGRHRGRSRGGGYRSGAPDAPTWYGCARAGPRATERCQTEGTTRG